MAGKRHIPSISALTGDYSEALVSSGLVDDVLDPTLLKPEPYRYTEGEVVCRHGDPADCLWIIVNGSIAVKEQDRTLFVRRRNEIVGEQHLVGNGYRRIYDLVADESSIEVLKISKWSLEAHPEAGIIWRNIAKIISIKLRNASRKTSSLSRQLADDTQILHAYTNQYALSRRMQAGGEHLSEHIVEEAVIWFSDVVGFSRHTLNIPPDRIADLVQRFFNAQSHPIVDGGGHIDKFIGDGLMAFWVLPETGTGIRQKCVAALRAAEQADAAVNSIKIGNEALSLRIGLHTGMVLSGDFGSTMRHQFTLIGREVNKTARLEQLRDKNLIGGKSSLGHIRISPEFYENLGELDRRKFCGPFLVESKNMGEMQLYTNC